jgi:3-oxoacyl-[acyl-carrier protein] reductase
MIDTGLKGRVALVTGANHGMGAATAMALARQGVRVFVTYLRLLPGAYGGPDEKDAVRAAEPGRAYYSRILMKTADDVVRSIRKSGGEGVALEMDLANPENIPAVFDKAEEQLGPVEILVNNAAFDRCDTFVPPDELKKNPMFVDEYPMTPISASTHDEHFAVNSRATAMMMKEFAGRHIGRKAKWGRIINISTDGAYAHPSNVSYGASKLALESYSRAAACELGPYGITVNVISPGAVQTGWMPQELTKQLEQTYPLRRVGEPEDIANAVVFFASKQAGWITGQVLFVGGGHRM